MTANTNLRILHIAETYPPDYGGGAAIYIQDTCRFLAERGHEVRVLCVENSDSEPYSVSNDYDERVLVQRINLPYFKSQDPEGWQLGLRRWRKHQKRIVHLINSMVSHWRPDLVHYSTARPLGEECLLTISHHNIPIVGFIHEAWLICPRLNLINSPSSELCAGPKPLRCLECLYTYYDRPLAKALLKLPWRLLKLGIYPSYRLWRRGIARRCLVGATTYSKFMTSRHELHINGPVQYIQLGINTAGVPPPRVTRSSAPVRFGFVGGFQPIKGIWHILDAAASLKQEGYAFELHIWGPNHERDYSEVTDRNLDDRVFLRGMYNINDIWGVYAEMDVALMATTVCETLGRVPLEAAAVSVPTIAPAVGGITETIRDGVDGLLFRFRDKKDLEQKMRRILEEPGLLENLRKNVRLPPDTRERVSAIEQFYFSVLRLAPKSASASA